MLDFEQIGNQMGYARSLESLRDAAIRELNALTAEIDKANQIIADQHAQTLQLQQQLADMQLTLAVQQAHAVGISAQGMALKAELERIDPNHALLAKTGKVYKTGVAQTNLKVVYDAAFDEKAQELNLTEPHQFRLVAE